MTEGNEVLDELLSDAPAAADTTATTETPAASETATQARDEHGRFAPKAADLAPVAAPEAVVEAPAAQVEEPAQTTNGMVPIAALHAERQKSKTFGDQIAEMQRKFDEQAGQIALLTQRQPQQAPQPIEQPKKKEFWDDPDGFAQEAVNQALDPVQKQIRSVALFYSRREANREFGAEKVTAAEAAMKAAVANGTLDRNTVAAQLAQSMDPVGDVVRWHQKASALERVGTDPDAWLKSELERLKADPAFQAEVIAVAQGAAANPANANRSSPPATRLPPTLARLPGGGNTVSDDVSDEALFAHATAR